MLFDIVGTKFCWPSGLLAYHNVIRFKLFLHFGAEFIIIILRVKLRCWYGNVFVSEKPCVLSFYVTHFFSPVILKVKPMVHRFWPNHSCNFHSQKANLDNTRNKLFLCGYTCLFDDNLFC